jgi:hypothetical protein
VIGDFGKRQEGGLCRRKGARIDRKPSVIAVAATDAAASLSCILVLTGTIPAA